MLGDRRLAHGEGRGELGHRGFAERQPGEDRPPGRIGERGEGGIESIGGWHA